MKAAGHTLDYISPAGASAGGDPDDYKYSEYHHRCSCPEHHCVNASPHNNYAPIRLTAVSTTHHTLPRLGHRATAAGDKCSSFAHGAIADTQEKQGGEGGAARSRLERGRSLTRLNEATADGTVAGGVALGGIEGRPLGHQGGVAAGGAEVRPLGHQGDADTSCFCSSELIDTADSRFPFWDDQRKMPCFTACSGQARKPSAQYISTSTFN